MFLLDFQVKEVPASFFPGLFVSFSYGSVPKIKKFSIVTSGNRGLPRSRVSSTQQGNRLRGRSLRRPFWRQKRPGGGHCNASQCSQQTTRGGPATRALSQQSTPGQVEGKEKEVSSTGSQGDQLQSNFSPSAFRTLGPG